MVHTVDFQQIVAVRGIDTEPPVGREVYCTFSLENHVDYHSVRDADFAVSVDIQLFIISKHRCYNAGSNLVDPSKICLRIIGICVCATLRGRIDCSAVKVD